MCNDKEDPVEQSHAIRVACSKVLEILNSIYHRKRDKDGKCGVEANVAEPYLRQGFDLEGGLEGDRDGYRNNEGSTWSQYGCSDMVTWHTVSCRSASS